MLRNLAATGNCPLTRIKERQRGAAESHPCQAKGRPSARRRRNGSTSGGSNAGAVAGTPDLVGGSRGAAWRRPTDRTAPGLRCAGHYCQPAARILAGWIMSILGALVLLWAYMKFMQ